MFSRLRTRREANVFLFAFDLERPPASASGLHTLRSLYH